MTAWTGVVLAGGESRRMGRDKSLLEVDGCAMAVRVATALDEGGCDPVIIQGGNESALGDLGLTVWPDEAPGGGPVAGLVSALQRADGPVVVAACDLPDLDSATVRRLIAVADADPDTLAVAASAGGQPALVAAWRPAAVDRLGEPAGRAYRAALRAVSATLVEVRSGVVRNVNEPDDLILHR